MSECECVQLLEEKIWSGQRAIRRQAGLAVAAGRLAARAAQDEEDLDGSLLGRLASA
jgi:hypothetical protein